MQTSNPFSRIRPKPSPRRSVYEALSKPDEASDESDIEENAGMRIDEANLDEPFHDEDLDQMLAEAADSQIRESTAFIASDRKRSYAGVPRTTEGVTRNARWMSGLHKARSRKVEDDEVPESLLLDVRPSASRRINTGNLAPQGEEDGQVPTILGPSSRNTQVQHETVRIQLPPHEDRSREASRGRQLPVVGTAPITADPKERAMWRWLNTTNLDVFLNSVYEYYVGRGIWSMMLARIFVLL